MTYRYRKAGSTSRGENEDPSFRPDCSIQGPYGPISRAWRRDSLEWVCCLAQRAICSLNLRTVEGDTDADKYARKALEYLLRSLGDTR